MTRELAQEFEWHARDVGIAEEDVKIHWVLELNQDTLSCLDAYVTMCGGDKMAAHLETIHDRLCKCSIYLICLDAGKLEVGS